VGLPLALVGQNLLHSLPNALQLAIGVLTLTATGVSAVLTRTGSSRKRSRYEASRAGRMAHRAPATLNGRVGRTVKIARARFEADHGKHWTPYRYVHQNTVAYAIEP
jgi:hypothetical protein